MTTARYSLVRNLNKTGTRRARLARIQVWYHNTNRKLEEVDLGAVSMEKPGMMIKRKIYGALCCKVLAKEMNRKHQTFCSSEIGVPAREA